ncbi:Site-specific recombinase XerD [Paraburkholderia steynii]|uniref:Site-specific recombinase XerD n=1 Tax=Paraburkholderia steynii TaxID=1245441 RepID=A0A7Z7BH55_9BURK|nr:site-specific integrase [Paraburkholderia steynii]SDJ23039.1 Site-specific recombinase XerD [Paraburkholderia steynii]
MSIRKHPKSGVYFIDIRTPGGERIRRSCGTQDRKEAQEYHDRVKAASWRTSKLSEKPSWTFEEAAMRYLTEEALKRDYESKERHLVWFGGRFPGRALHTITRAEVFDALPVEDQRRYCKGRKLSVSTRNRYLATIRGMLNAAVKWEWIDKAPKLNDMPVSNKRIRWITADEARALLAAIPTTWLRDITEMAFNTGLRWRNISLLEWSQVDLARQRAWIHPDQAKGKKPIGVPLNEAAVSIIRRQLGLHERFVFVNNGAPRKKSDFPQWRRACAKAGIKDFRFHDTRHTWASWHVQNGTPLNVLKELGGWSDYDMVLRYSHLAPDHLAQHANAVKFWAHPTPDNLGTPAKAVGQTRRKALYSKGSSDTALRRTEVGG